MLRRALAEPHEHHSVKFYHDDESLIATAGRFLGQGLLDEQPVILLATPDHTSRIFQYLEKRHVDVARAQRFRDLVAVDVEAALAAFMVDGAPDPVHFTSSIGGMIEELRSRQPRRTAIRAYGEIVDVLWKQGKSEAAIQLEILWNRLAAAKTFALLCGYAMGNFDKQTKDFEAVCGLHAHVMPADATPPA